MLNSFFLSKRWAIWAWGVLLVLLTSVATEVFLMVKLNGWYGEMWDMMQRADPETIGQFWTLIGIFCQIVFPFVLLRVVSSYLSQHYCFRWRQAMTEAYMPYWQKVNHDVEGASQRMQEDPQRFARITEQLALGFFRAVATLVAFVPILWALSANIGDKFTEWLNGSEFTEKYDSVPTSLVSMEWMVSVPGFLLWLSAGLALAAIVISYFVGIKLPGLEYNNQKVEARFRKRLVYAEDDKQYADTPTLLEMLTGLRFNYFRLFLHYSYFSLWQNFFFQFVIIVDLLVIGPAVIYGIVLLGTLHMVSHAFNSVSDSLSYFTDNWATVTELLSIIKRLREFEINIGFGEQQAFQNLPSGDLNEQ